MPGPLDLAPDPYGQLHPEFGPRVQALQDALRERYGLETDIGSGMRDLRTQQRLYSQGRGAPGPVVTYAPPGSSYHNYGAAVDLVPRGMPEAKASELVAQAIRENPDIGVRGIGAWDPFHVQLDTSLAALRRGGPTGLPEYETRASGAPAGPPVQANELAHGMLARAADNPADRAALGAPPSMGADPTRAQAMLAQLSRDRDAAEWGQVFENLKMKPQVRYGRT